MSYYARFPRVKEPGKGGAKYQAKQEVKKNREFQKKLGIKGDAIALIQKENKHINDVAVVKEGGDSENKVIFSYDSGCENDDYEDSSRDNVRYEEYDYCMNGRDLNFNERTLDSVAMIRTTQNIFLLSSGMLTYPKSSV